MFIDTGFKFSCQYEDVVHADMKTQTFLSETQRIRTGQKSFRQVEGSPMTALFSRNEMKTAQGTIVSVKPIEFEGDLIQMEYKDFTGRMRRFPLMPESALIICKETPENPNDVVWTQFLTKTVGEIIAEPQKYCIPDMGDTNSMPYGTTIFYYRVQNYVITRVPYKGTLYEVECEKGYSLVIQDTYLQSFDMIPGRIMTGNRSEYEGGAV